jgi:hypothetical protein
MSETPDEVKFIIPLKRMNKRKSRDNSISKHNYCHFKVPSSSFSKTGKPERSTAVESN